VKLLNDEDIIEHYGIKGMKWKNHKYATKKQNITGHGLFSSTDRANTASGLSKIGSAIGNAAKNTLNNARYAVKTSQIAQKNRNTALTKQNKNKVKKAVTNNSKNLVANALSRATGGLATAAHAINIGKNTISQINTNKKYGKKWNTNTVFTKKGSQKAAKSLGKTYNITKNVSNKIFKKGTWNKSVGKGLTGK
jgi:hypothetical protein